MPEIRCGEGLLTLIYIAGQLEARRESGFAIVLRIDVCVCVCTCHPRIPSGMECGAPVTAATPAPFSFSVHPPTLHIPHSQSVSVQCEMHTDNPQVQQRKDT